MSWIPAIQKLGGCWRGLALKAGLERCLTRRLSVNYRDLKNQNRSSAQSEAMNTSKAGTQPEVPVDVIIPVFNERQEAIGATLDACLNQTYPVSHIYVIDDGSPVPAAIPQRIEATGKVSMTRLSRNQKNAAARNVGIEKSAAPLVACVNCEVLPAEAWLATCVNYLLEHPDVGICFTRIIPHHPNRLLSRWRMRFQEIKFGDMTGPCQFAPGHAVLFRREVVEKVGRYNTRLGNVCEDSDICERIRAAGWDTHFIAQSHCVSIQNDTVTEFAKKELSRNDWETPEDYPVSQLILQRSKWTLIRMGRNMLKARLLFLPVDVAVWTMTVKIAISRTLATRGHRRSDL
jgi:cellulose synthase/poly-beta-1,6-N-acetylglucosamine synthase-like glycosyltransferase